jgi:hypothetical protein
LIKGVFDSNYKIAGDYDFLLDAEILLDLFLLILYPLKSEMVELAEDRYRVTCERNSYGKEK